MELFRRIRYTVTAGVESLLDQVENQEAVATASIREVEHMAARIRAARKRSDRELEQLEREHLRLTEERTRWRARATRAKQEREKALECLRRGKAAEQALNEVEQRIERQRAVCQRIVSDERALDCKLSELRARCAELSSRQARSVALSDRDTPAAIDAVLDRWEARLGESPEPVPSGRNHDAFARQWQRQEDDETLAAELDALLNTEEQAG